MGTVLSRRRIRIRAAGPRLSVSTILWTTAGWSKISLAAIGMQICCAKYPSAREVDQELATMLVVPIEARAGKLAHLLNSMSDPQQTGDDEALRHLVQLLVEEYRQSQQDWILTAVDQVKFDGGFANAMCGLYERLLNDTALRKRYAQPSRNQALRRCVGISLSREQYDAIAAGN